MAATVGTATAQMPFGAIGGGTLSRTVGGGLSDAISQNAREAVLPPLAIRSSAGPVGALSLSASGSHMAVAPGDRTLRIWDLAAGLEARRITGLSETPIDVAIDRAGRFVAAADGRSVKLWSIADGQLLHSLDGHGERVNAVAFGADGRLMTGGDDHGIVEWDAAEGRQLRRFSGHDAAVRAIAFSADGKTMATGGADGGVLVWDVAGGTAGEVFGPSDDGLATLTITPDGRYVATGAKGGDVVLWSAAGERIGRFGSHGGPVAGLAFSPDGAMLASVGDDNSVWLWRVADREQRHEMTGHRDKVLDVAFDPSHGRVVSASADGLVRVWDAAAGQSLARVVSTGRGWAVVDGEGRFDGSLEALRDIAWVGGAGEVEIDRLSERYYKAGLLAIMLDPSLQAADASKTTENVPPTPVEPAHSATRALPPPTAELLTASIEQLPQVKLLAPKDGAVVEADDVEVTVQVVDSGSGVDEIRLFHNGRVVTDGGDRAATLTDRSGARRLLHTFNIRLAPGNNELRAVAFSEKRAESEPVSAHVRLDATPARPTVHIVAVGINDYKNPALNLNYGVPDAQGIVAAFRNSQDRLYEAVNGIEIHNAAATREGILGAIRSLRDTDPGDIVVVYLAGHGEMTESGDWYFLPHELVYPERPGELERHGISSQQLQSEIANVGGRKVMLLIDACKSGGALLALRGFEERKALRQLARSTGVHIVAAAAQDQFAGEVARLNHGVFTYVVLEALSGKADGAPHDGIVSVREMLSYVESRMPEVSLMERSRAQYPVVDSRGMDFPIAAGPAK